MEDIEEARKKNSQNRPWLAEERLNQLQYLQADFDNFRRWSAKEKDMITALANEKLIHTSSLSWTISNWPCLP